MIGDDVSMDWTSRNIENQIVAYKKGLCFLVFYFWDSMFVVYHY